MKSRMLWVDYAKGLGIFLVVWGHLTRGLQSAGINISHFQLLDSLLYSFHMPLFFFLAGLFLLPSLEKQGLSFFCIQKLKTIFYPFVIWSILQGSIEAAMSQYTNSKTHPSAIYVFLWEPKAQFWYLHTLFILFLVTAILLTLSRIRAMPWILLSGGILLYLSPLIWSTYPVLNAIARSAAFLLLGVAASQYGIWQAVCSRNGTLIGSAGLLVAVEWGFHGPLGLRYDNYGIASFVVSLVAIAFCSALSMCLVRLQVPFFAAAGRASLPIYLTHVIAASGSRIVLQRFFHVDSSLLHILIGMSVGIGAPLTCWTLAQRLHCTFLFSFPRIRGVSL